MTRRDPRHRGLRYDGAAGRRELARWGIRGIRVLAVPTVLLSLLLAVDAILPGASEVGLAYRSTVHARWLAPTAVGVSVGWPNRPGCLEPRGDAGRRFLVTTRPGCAGTVSVHPHLGRRVAAGDTLRVVRTPLFGQVRTIFHPAADQMDRWVPLWDLGLVVLVGLVPLLSFGRAFGVYDTQDGVSRYHFAYLFPSLLAEAFYARLLVQAVMGFEAA
jgi:hypothetical protein